MLSSTQRRFESVPVYTNAQPPPKEFVLDEVLKVVELQLAKRGLLQDPATAGIYPLWFLAETERNVFLWRHGLSLDDRVRFEFWINSAALIRKRLGQLGRSCPDNPFVHHDSADLRTREEQYLEQLLALEEQIGLHAHALSLVASELQQECAQHITRERVLLPGAA